MTPVRGAGRQHGVFVSERLLDIAAKELGIDRVEIRKRNLLGPDRFPHNHEIMFQDSAPLIYDSGNYLPTLEQRRRDDRLRASSCASRPRLRAEGKHVGIGIVCYVEGTGIGPYEGARVTVEPSGKVRVATGVGTQGQGHFTVFAQIVADVLGVDVTDVRVDHRRHARVPVGHRHVREPRRGRRRQRVPCRGDARCAEKILDARQRRCSTCRRTRSSSRAAACSCRGSAERGLTLGELAGKANPLRGAVRPGTEPGLESTAYFGPDRGSTASGVHAMIVEVDPETAMVEIKRYVVVHDCGTIINPLLVEGQIHGGVAHGIGNAFYEQLVYDEQGQLLNASFMDYLLPTATDVPPIETAHRETPSPFNPVGLKGVGEAGCIPDRRACSRRRSKMRWPTIGIEITRDPAEPEPAVRAASRVAAKRERASHRHESERHVHLQRSAQQRSGICCRIPMVLAKALPGTERLTRTGEDRYEGVMKVSVGPVTAAKFDVVGRRSSDKVEPERFTMQIDGKGARRVTRRAPRSIAAAAITRRRAR